MALGTLSSLGFASNVLTQDTIDKLKKAEEGARINPYTTKLEENTNKKKDVTELITKLSTFKTAVSSLGDASVFSKRKVNSSVSENPPATLRADSGVALQSMKIDVTQLAQKDVFQSKGLANDTGFVNANLSAPTKFTLFSNKKSYEISVDKNMTYQDLANKINEATGGEITAKIINTGEKGAPYRLTLTSKETGEDHAISFYAGAKDNAGKFSESADAKNVLASLGWELDDATTVDPATDKKGYTIKEPDPDNKLHIQVGQDAKFTLDGIKMTRSSNNVDDIGVGLHLTLNKIGEVNFDIQQDVSAASETMQSLVDSYNDLMTNLNASTDFNSETGTKGTLQGVNEITSIRSTINNTLFGYQSVDGEVLDDNGNKISSKILVSLQDYGIVTSRVGDVSTTGSISFDSAKFEAKMKEDPGFAESFFAGITQFEDINYESNLIDGKKLTTAVGANGLALNAGDFSIVYNDQSYDLSKTADGQPFILTGANEQEIMQNLVTHINSLRIDGLTAKFEPYNQNGQSGYHLKINGQSGTDFSIKGKKDVLEKFGLSETKLVAQPKEAKGIFANLKNVVDGITGKNGSLTKYDEYLTEEKKGLDANKESTQNMINKRYETMQDQFVQYERILSKLSTQLSTISQMINAANNQNNN